MWQRRLVNLGISVAIISPLSASLASRVGATPLTGASTVPNEPVPHQEDIASAETGLETAIETGPGPETGSGNESEELANVRSRLADLEALPLFLPTELGTVDADDAQLSSTQLSRPSFAWIRDQVAQRYASETSLIEIVSQWQAYTTNDGFQYLDVIVNESQWEQLNSLRRYGFVVQFGTVAQSHGYQLRIFHTGDAANRKDAISLQSQNRNVVSRSIRLRGTYFCASSAEQLPACSTFVAQ